MASRAGQWRRLHGLFRAPEYAYTQHLAGPHAGTWTTDRYVIVSHAAAGLPAVEPGAWKLSATAEPRPQDAHAVAPDPGWYAGKLDRYAACEWGRDLAVTPWLHAGELTAAGLGHFRSVAGVAGAPCGLQGAGPDDSHAATSLRKCLCVPMGRIRVIRP
jgi:hypothetical protein